MNWLARLAWTTPAVALLARWFFVLVSPIWSPLAFLLRGRRWLWLQRFTNLVPATTLARAEARLRPSDAATLKHYHLLLAEVRGVADWAEQLRQAQYDESVHAASFLALWNALRPDTPAPSIPSPAWGELGFQGKDPATDLRGSGLAGLTFLLYFAETFPDSARRSLLQASHPQHWMPFACAGINLTAFLLRDLLNTPDPTRCLLAPHLLHHGTTPEQLRVAFCYLLVELCDAYRAAAPANVMAFPGIMAAFQQRVRAQLATEGLLFTQLADTPLKPRDK